MHMHLRLVQFTICRVKQNRKSKQNKETNSSSPPTGSHMNPKKKKKSEDNRLCSNATRGFPEYSDQRISPTVTQDALKRNIGAWWRGLVG